MLQYQQELFMYNSKTVSCILHSFRSQCGMSKEKNFSNTSYKNMKKKIHSMDIFKELTFKETCSTITNFET